MSNAAIYGIVTLMCIFMFCLVVIAIAAHITYRLLTDSEKCPDDDR